MKQIIHLKDRYFFDLLFFCVLLILSLVLFFPVISKPFASDDYSVMYRLAYQKNFFIKGFFRPVSDFTLYFTYLIGEFNPIVYNIFNLLIHASSAFLLYKVCSKIKLFLITDQPWFPFLCSLLFLTYPFHNESIVWVVGRASIVACFFSFLALNIILSDKSAISRIFWACIFYFIGLCSYETIIPLPFIVFALLYTKQWRKDAFLKRIVLALMGTLLLNLLLRRFVAGVITGSYGERLFSWQDLIIRMLKGFGRQFLPPTNNSALLSGLFTFLLICCVCLFYFIYISRRSYWISLVKLSVIVIMASLIPVMFGVSTKSIEGDRLFYFPSFFLCMWVGFLVCLIKQRFKKALLACVILVYNIVFLEINNLIWRKSGEVITVFLENVKHYKKSKRELFIINIPDDYKGAQVFRNGLKQALLINNIDTSGIRPINFVSSNVFNGELMRNKIIDKQIDFASGVIVMQDRILFKPKNDTLLYKFFYSSNSLILHWDGKELMPVEKLWSTYF